MRRAGNCLRSPVLLGTSFPNQALVPFPPTNDPDLYAWWTPESYTSVVPVDSTQIYTVGNKADWQVDKTDRTSANSSNLVPINAGSLPYLTRADSSCNLVFRSEDISAWPYKTSATTPNASTITFTAQNGRVETWLYPNLLEGRQCILSVQLRRISGNYNLELRTDSTYTPITITDSLATYSVTFTLASGHGTTYLGIRDPNAAGWGQVEVTKWHLRYSDSPSTYVRTVYDDAQIPVKTPTGLPALAFGQGWGMALFNYDGGNVKNTADAHTIYMTIRPQWRSTGRLFVFSGPIYNFLFSMESSTGQYRIYSHNGVKSIFSDASWLTDYQWAVITITISTMSSGTGTLRKNLGTAYSGPLGIISPNVNMSGMASYSADGLYAPYYLTDFIWRKGVDSAAKQEAYVRYLANRVGVSL